MIELLHMDCMTYMAGLPDKAFDLAIVDPPYGINFSEFNRTNRTSTGTTIKADKYKNSNWDDAKPQDEYFAELRRVSENQIVWGGNYFPQLWGNGCKGFVFWNKGNPVPNFSDGELAWTSFNSVARAFNFKYYGNLEGNTSASTKIHPTQKPVALYEWLLTNYAKPGQRILDTHLGSGSSAIAAYNLGYEFVGMELDADYYAAAVQRFEQHKAQGKLFDVDDYDKVTRGEFQTSFL
jgi:site-specific DNA-methyltransferase (adenine-specific)